MTLKELQQKTTPILEKYPLKYAGVFGSFARGEAGSESDIDIMIDYNRPFSLLKLIGLEQDLQDTLKKRVDVITEPGLNKYIGPYILKDLKVFYGQR